MASLLTNLVIDSIGLVDKGASGDARNRPAVLLFKRSPQAVRKENPMDLNAIMAKLTPEEQAYMKQCMQKPPAPAAPPFGKRDEEDPVAKALAALPEEVRKQLEAQSAEVKKQLDAEKAEREALAKRLAAKEDEDLERTFVAKAATMKALSTTPEKLGRVLKSASKALAKDDLAELERVLASANEAIAKGKLFAELGASGADGDTAYGKIRAIAKQLREKDATLSEAQSIAKAADMNPELARQYAQERK